MIVTFQSVLFLSILAPVLVGLGVAVGVKIGKGIDKKDMTIGYVAN